MFDAPGIMNPKCREAWVQSWAAQRRDTHGVHASGAQCFTLEDMARMDEGEELTFMNRLNINLGEPHQPTIQPRSNPVTVTTTVPQHRGTCVAQVATT